MVKFIHTSDWHLGQSFHNYSKSDEYISFFQQLAAVVEKEKPDALLVSGDIYHVAAPSAVSQKMFVEGLMLIRSKSPEMGIIITAGNHDSYSMIESHRELWGSLNVSVVGFPEYEEDSSTVKSDKLIVPIKKQNEVCAYVIAVPFIHQAKYGIFRELQKEVEERNTHDVPVVQMAHLSMKGCIGSERYDVGGLESVTSSDLGDGYDYLALGHIHKEQTLDSENRVRYCGTPIQTSFDENSEHSVTLVEIEKRGARPDLKILRIENENCYLTLPEEEKPFEDVLKDLSRIQNEKKGFLRVRLKRDETPSVDEEQKIKHVLDGKSIRFCYSFRESLDILNEVGSTISDVEKIREMNPLLLAMEYYKKQKRQEMPDDLQRMFKEAVEEIDFQ